MGRNVLKSSLQSAYFSIVFQILCRGITFGINAFIVRKVGREVLGIMNVRLLLLESTLLFLSREAITRAALSSTTQHNNKCNWPQLINQLWLTVPLCTILCIPCLYIWINILSPVDSIYYNQYKFGCMAIAFSCIIELCAEAPVFITQVYCFIKLRIVLNTLHIFVRSTIFIFIVLNNQKVAIYAFGIAQVASAATIIFGHYGFFYYYIKNLKMYLKGAEYDKKYENGLYYTNMDDFPFRSITEMIPGALPNQETPFNTELQSLTLSFVKQGIFKQILTEGEKYVMTVSPVLSFSEQATYDVVNNLGSLAARFIFRPIEDSSYFYFTQTLARDIELIKQDKTKVNEAGQVLKIACKAVSSIGYMAFTFGQSYSGSVLLLYGGADFVSGGLPEKLLRWHSLAICFLAINGITEGYMFATNTSKDIDKYNYIMAIFSITFLLLSYFLTNIFGPVGFILANCLNMLFRMCYSISYIWQQYKPLGQRPLDGILPGRLFFTSLIIMGILCKVSEIRLGTSSILYHLGIGCVCVFLSLLAWAIENKPLVKIALDKYGYKTKIIKSKS